MIYFSLGVSNLDVSNMIEEKSFCIWSKNFSAAFENIWCFFHIIFNLASKGGDRGLKQRLLFSVVLTSLSKHRA